MSAVRDLGYKPYEGTRLPPSHNAWVMFRHGLSRAWESWLVKLSVIFGLFPGLAHAALLAIKGYSNRNDASGDGLEMGWHLHVMLIYQLWLFVSAVTLGAGASTLTEDAAFKTFPFYFAKPVTPTHYLIGRIGAVAMLCALLFVVPGSLMVLIGSVVESPERRTATLLYLPKIFAFVAVAAPMLAVTSIGSSALGRSRAVTMSIWVLLFVIPFVLAGLLDLFIDGEWLNLLSIPALLKMISAALFEPDPNAVPSAVRWYHAVLVLAALSGASLAMTLKRLRSAEVIA